MHERDSNLEEYEASYFQRKVCRLRALVEGMPSHWIERPHNSRSQASRPWLKWGASLCTLLCQFDMVEIYVQ
jgi:hypothetical protein